MGGWNKRERKINERGNLKIANPPGTGVMKPRTILPELYLQSPPRNFNFFFFFLIKIGGKF